VALALGAAALAVYFGVRLNGADQLRVSRYTQITHDGHTKFIGGTDGSRIYFTQDLPKGIAEVSVSGGVVAPIPTTLLNPWAGDVSPDGSTLLLISQGGGLGPANSLWSMRLLGGSLRQLANASVATWSPDGEKIAYAITGGDIYVMRSDGTEAHQIASPGVYVKSLAWSPDGGAIRFSKEASCGRCHRMDPIFTSFCQDGEHRPRKGRRMGAGWEILLRGRRPDMGSR